MMQLNIAWRRPKSGRNLFFIGFNKCGTKSLHALVAGSGYRALHGRWKHLSGQKTNIALQMSTNLAAGAPILAGLGNHDVFSDLTSVTDSKVVEACRFFPELYREYPDAYYVLNTRPVDDWIGSRLNHGNSTIGSFTERYMRATGDSEEQVIERWRADFREHTEAARSFFADKGRFLEFSICGDVSPLIDFVRGDYVLNARRWGHHGKASSRNRRGSS